MTPSTATADTFEHLVQLYEDDDSLARNACSYLGASLGAGQSAVVIATRAHRERFERQLEAHVNLQAAKSGGRFLSLDADETLARVMVDGAPDARRFEQVVGTIVEGLTKGGRGLRAYGEMVAVLQSRGKTDAALALERLWNELGKTRRFSLFCAYEAHAVSELSEGQQAGILAAHTGVADEASGRVGAPSVQLLARHAGPVRAELEERLKVEAELRRSREELRSFVENASIALHWVGPDGIIKWANAAEYRMLGYAREEYVGQHISKFHADKRVIDDILARLTRGERLQDKEARLKCKDGSLKTVLIDSCVLWQDGRFVHTQCFTRDVTRQRQAERASQHLASLVESSEDAIMSQDVKGTVLTWNRAAERVYGWAAHEMVGRTTSVLIPDGLMSQEAVILARIVAGERVEHFETVRRRKDGSLVEVSLTISPIRAEDGRVVGISRIARDVTESRRAQAAIRKAEETNRHLAEIIESADTAIMSIDLEGKINAWNRAAQRLFGYAKDEIVGRSFEVLVPAEADADPRKILARLRAGESPEPYRAVRLRKDGTAIQVSIKVSPVRSSDGAILGGSALIREANAL